MIARSALAAALSSVILLAAVPCAADEPAPPARRPSLAETLTGEAKVDYDAAKILFEDGDFPGASSKFQQAYDRTQEPRLLWNVAVCEKGLRHYARVQKLVLRYLDDAKDVLSPEQTKAARDLAEAVKAFVGTLRISAEPGTVIGIDGEPVGTTPLAQPISLDLGKHKLTGDKDGFYGYTSYIEIAGGTESTHEVVLKSKNAKAHLSINAGEGDTISLDGAVISVTRWQGNVDAGTHSLHVTASQRKPFDLRLDLVDGANRTVDVTLENQSRSVWPWIAGGIALAGLAVVGGYFVFKGDEKPATQPNASLGLVELARGWPR